MSNDEALKRSQFVYATLAHNDAHRLPVAVRVQLAYVYARELHRASPAHAQWHVAVMQHLVAPDQRPLPHLPPPAEAGAAALTAPPRQVALAAVEIELHPAARQLPREVRDELWRIVLQRPQRRSAEQTAWVRAVWRALYVGDSVPPPPSVSVAAAAANDVTAPPSVTRQLVAEVLTHPDFGALSDDEQHLARDTALRVAEGRVVRVGRRRTLTRQWRALYTPRAAGQ